MVPSGFYHFWGYISPLRNAASLKEIEEYPLEDVSKWDYSGVAAAVKKGHDEGKVVSGWVGHMYENAWQIRGYEQFLMDMIERPAWSQCLLDRLAEQNMYRATQFAKAGVDLMTTGDDVANQKAMMFQPSMWREMMHSRWAKIWDTIHRIHPTCQIWYHSDGNIMDIIPDLVDAGLNVLNPLQPECLDVDRVHREFGKVLSFDGTIGTQSTMPWGTPASVKAQRQGSHREVRRERRPADLPHSRSGARGPTGKHRRAGRSVPGIRREERIAKSEQRIGKPRWSGSRRRWAVGSRQ